jgi:IMP dehydrogenase
MSLFFNYRGIGERSKALTFNDCLLVPQYTEVSSRKDPTLASQLTKKFRLDIPLIAANMDTISEIEMMKAMSELGGMAILHRFMTIEAQCEQLKSFLQWRDRRKLATPAAASIGVKEEGKERAKKLIEAGAEILTLDIAHGDSIMMLETLEYVKKTWPSIEVIAGNVATPGAVKRLFEAGASAIKVGIGPGSMCTTRIITGHGVPQLTAIALCALEAEKYQVPVIADGGIKNSGDMVKALAAGAHSLMVGSLLAGTTETPGELIGGKKLYRGMASQSAQVSWRGELPQGMAAEGESTLLGARGAVADVIHELLGGVRSGMTYMGALSLEEMKEKALFCEMTAAGFSESKPHGVV